jgi:hypothetical protein
VSEKVYSFEPASQNYKYRKNMVSKEIWLYNSNGNKGFLEIVVDNKIKIGG